MIPAIRQSPPVPVPPDVWATLLTVLVNNPLATMVVSIIFGLYMVGRFDTTITVKKTLTDAEKVEAIEKIRSKKKSSPQTAEILAMMKRMIEMLEDEDDAA